MSTMVVTTVIAMLALLGTTYLAAHYLWSLPYAPDCPACTCVTGQATRVSRVDRLLARGGAVSTRQCPRCGWSGRMRWRLATERVRRK